MPAADQPAEGPADRDRGRGGADGRVRQREGAGRAGAGRIEGCDARKDDEIHADDDRRQEPRLRRQDENPAGKRGGGLQSMG